MENTRKLVPSSTKNLFDDIVTGRVLGASNHIRMISNMIVDIAKNSNDKESALIDIGKVSTYFKETRGKSSYAIVNALEEMEKNIEEKLIDDETCYKKSIEIAIKKYFVKQDENLDLIIKYSLSLVEKIDCIMIYDYSSTVEKFVANINKRIKVYVPESRPINGGYPFLTETIIKNHDVRFIPDANMFNVLHEVKACFIGAETFYPDGTAFNTVGSDMLAELCYYHHVPYYVLTPLLKADKRSVYGIYKETIEADLKNVLANDWEDEIKNNVDFNAIELVGVNPSRITNYVTELGIIKPSDLFSITFLKGSE